MPTSTAPTSHDAALAWIEEVRELCEPADLHWVDGSEAECDELCRRLVAAGTSVESEAERLAGQLDQLRQRLG